MPFLAHLVHNRTTQDHPAGSPGCTGMVLSSASDLSTMTTCRTSQHPVTTEAVPNSSTGSAGHHANDNRLSLTQRVTPQKPLRSAGPAIQNDGSTPEGWPSAPGTRGGIETPVARGSQTDGVGSVSRRLGRRAASVCVRVRVCVGHRKPTRGPIQATGSRTPPQRGPVGVTPQGRSLVRTRSPVSPQLGGQLPSSVQCAHAIRGHSPIMSYLSKGFGS